MSMQSIEVEIDAAGRVHAVDPQVAVPAGRALLTPLAPRRTALEHGAPAERPDDCRSLVGALSGSPSWREPPQAIQDRLRDEWR